MNTTLPTPPQSDALIPPGGVRYPVTARDSWISLAAGLKMEPWDLIDFNFPGLKRTSLANRELATRQMNWYLQEYVGCSLSRDGGKNYAFSDGLTGGRGVHKGGIIFLPPRPVPPAPAQCKGIDFTTDDLSPIAIPMIRVFANLPIVVSFHARCLDPSAELPLAKSVYGGSLNYDDIYVSSLSGTDNRPFTIAVQVSGRWVVVLNLGRLYENPGADPSTLVHELAHAWQSQHHSNPQRFMINSVESQALESVSEAANSTTGRIVGVVVGAPPVIPAGAGSYAYVPGKPFGTYGAEQIAQQVEDFFFGRPGFDASVRPKLLPIWQHMLATGRGAVDAENVRGLSSPHVEFRGDPGVVWR